MKRGLVNDVILHGIAYWGNCSLCSMNLVIRRNSFVEISSYVHLCVNQ